jgi:hypothetical protein
VKPTGDGGMRFQLIGRLPESDKDVLGDFLSRSAISNLTHGRGEDEVNVLANQGGKRLLIGHRIGITSWNVPLF